MDRVNALLSRRTLLKWMAAGTGTMALAACAPAAAPAGNQAGGESAPAKANKELRMLVCCMPARDQATRGVLTNNTKLPIPV